MSNMKHRILAVLLVGLLCFTMLPLTAFAGSEPELEEPAESLVEETTEEAAEDIIEEPAEEPVETPVEEPTEELTGEPAEEPSEDAVEEPAETVAEPEYHVEVDDLTGYYNEPVALTIRVEDVGGTGWEKVEASLSKDDGNLRTDLTESLRKDKTAQYTVSDNGTVYFFITDLEGTEYMETYSVTCFDYDPPVVEAGIRSKLLRVEAADALSGVAGIYVNGQLYTTLRDGVLDLRIDNCTDAQLFFIRAVDRLGNKSGNVVLSNPFYEEPVEETPEEDTDKNCSEDHKNQESPAETTTPAQPAETTPAPSAVPASTQPTQTISTQPAASSAGTSSGTGTAVTLNAAQSSTAESSKEEQTKETVTKEPGEGFSENGNAVTRDLLYDKYTNKQFITITDRDGNTFYMVIDYDSPINEDEEQYQTYFLNPVDTADLMALIGEDGATAETVDTCSCTEPCQPGAVNMNCAVCAKDMTACVCAAMVQEPEQTEEPAETEPEEEQEEETSGLNPAVPVVLLIALIGGGGAFAYFKLVKNKPKTKGNADLDDYDYGDEDDAEDAPWESEDEDSAEPETSEDDAD